ncbi:MBL fold metallo-hydrolase [Halovulum dunhuangense]|uniref:MBL fold metallo-hydrolase n=1 Tax=Halovulum dunhuangense TaxID=1505036 RepID=A0A849L405_9RHOB|nr:MBL fold metallo-hydrolase [Halovulum dunhuangense]
MTRRDLLLTGAAGAATAAAMPAFGAAPMMGATRPGFRRMTLGNFEVTVLLDGFNPVEGPQGIFGQDQTVETVEALLTENLLPTNAMEFTFHPVLVNTGTELILFDTGNGEGARPARGHLLERMAEAGYSPDQVDKVVITHWHGDHINGMTEGGALTFANAEYVTGATEFDFWTSDARMGTPAEGNSNTVKGLADMIGERITLLEPGQTVASGIEAVGAFGHTPGHMVYHLESEGRRLMLAADTANHFVLSLQRPDWEVRFDMDKAAAAASRKEIFGMLAADRVPFVGYHMPFPGVGFVEARGEGFRYVPVSYQLSL